MKLAEVVGRLDIDNVLKLKYTRMATVFEDEIEENLVRSHFELERATGMPYDDWDSFLSITEVAGWLNETMRQVAKAGQRRLMKDLQKGAVEAKDINAFKTIKEFNEENNTVDNSNIVIMYLPPEEEE